jgi:hypothetical protein
VPATIERLRKYLILNQKEIGKWEECVWQDIRILGIKNWMNVASNREEWQEILRKARAHKGLSRQ